jgi:hypothetical protein
MLGFRMEESTNLGPKPAIQSLECFDASRGQRMSRQQSIEKGTHDIDVAASSRLAALDELRRHIGQAASAKRRVMKSAHIAG